MLSPVEPRRQWTQSGGYCGSLSVQAIALSYGVWISQSVVRMSAADGGGHGDPNTGYEILHTNLGGALDTLGLTYIEFSSSLYPQSPAYLEWLKEQLAAGHRIIWFIMCKGDSHNSYDLPNATYDHVEPVFGIYSNNLSAPVLGDDVLVHGSDYAPDGEANTGYFRRFDSLVDTTDMAGNCSLAIPVWGKNEMYPCLDLVHSFGFAVTGLARGPTMPISMTVDTLNEPDVAAGDPPGPLTATVTVSDLEVGHRYLLYRFDRGNAVVPDSIGEYHQEADWVLAFYAPNTSFVWTDSHPILSNTSVAYRAVNQETDDDDHFDLLQGPSMHIINSHSDILVSRRLS